MRAGRWEGVGRRRRKRHARGKADPRLLGARARAERTWNIRPMSVTLEVSKLSGWLKACACSNMANMFVTLEVSKLSGWLKAYACCRVEGRGMRWGVRCGPGGRRV